MQYFFGLTQFGTDNLRQHSSCVGRLAESDVTVMPSVAGVTEHTGDVVLTSIALAFATKTSTKHKSTPPNAIQVKNNSGRQSVLKRN